MKKYYLFLTFILILTSCSNPSNLQPTTEEVVTIVKESSEPTTPPETSPATVEVAEPEPEPSVAAMIHMLSKDALFKTIIVDANGALALEQTFASGDYLPGTSYAQLSNEDDYALIDLRDLAIFPAEDLNTLYALIADKVYHSDIVPFKDAESNLYGYKQDDQVLLAPTYTSASQFIDGYAVVMTGQTYDGTSSIIDKQFNPIYSSDEGILAFGHGFFGQVYDFNFPFNNNWYNKFILINAEGKPLTDEVFFEAHVITDDLLLVGDHLKHWYIDGNGEKVVSENTDLLSLAMNNAIYWTGDYYLSVDDPYSYSHIGLYDGSGHLLYNSNATTLPVIDQISDDISLEHRTIIQEKFTTITLPKLSAIGHPELFDDFNQQLLDNHYTQWEIESVEMVSSEISLDFDSSLHGNILDINLYYYWYGFGAAHPNHSQETIHVDLTTGLSYLASDLSSREDFYPYLTQLVQAQASENDPEAYWSIDEIIVDATTQYTHTDEGLQVYYSPYDISAYAYGYPKFDIPYTALEGYLDLNSDYYKALMAQVSK